ncbi:hypothetical protein B0H19DRAFT_1380288 [Mycena capillaripes]|nr:hypothetical protein B0H19DRAFT_1380288 [Mycena capillaripes]
MATTIQVIFQALGLKYTCRKWDIPDHNADFEPLAPNATTLLVPRNHLLAINQGPNRLPMKLAYDTARSWGVEEDDPSVLYVQAHIKENTDSLAFQAYEKLIEDATFHSTNLVSAEGVLVPQHYGLWLLDTGDWGGKVVCSITQWCGRSWYELSRTPLNTEANRILVGRTFEALHDYGIQHGSIDLACDFRHVILAVDDPALSEDDARNGKAACFIADFATAIPTHDCKRHLPVLPLDAFADAEQFGCLELAKVNHMLNFMKPARTHRVAPSMHTYDVIHWHKKYTELHPELPNAHVLMVQREKFYKGMPPIYSDLHISFEDDGLYSKAILERDTESDEETSNASVPHVAKRRPPDLPHNDSHCYRLQLRRPPNDQS